MAINYIGEESIEEMTRLLLQNDKNIKGHLQDEINKKASSADLEVERKRINLLATLPSGSTTGDAELIDIRTGADGVSYDSAGNAVREQFAKAKTNINTIIPQLQYTFFT